MTSLLNKSKIINSQTQIEVINDEQKKDWVMRTDFSNGKRQLPRCLCADYNTNYWHLFNSTYLTLQTQIVKTEQRKIAERGRERERNESEKKE